MSGSSQPSQHEARHCQINQRFAGARQFFIIFAQAAIVVQPTKGSLHHPTARQNMKSLEVIVTLDDFPHPAKGGFDPVGKGLTAIACISPQQFQAWQVQTLVQLGQQLLAAWLVLHIAGGNQDREQQPHGIDHDMPFAAVHSFTGIIPSFSFDQGGFDRLGIDNGSTWRRFAAYLLSHLPMQQAIYLLPETIQSPLTVMVINRLPGRQIVGQHAPLTAGSQEIQHCVDDFTHWPLLGASAGAQGTGVRQKSFEIFPFLIFQIALICLSVYKHHNTPDWTSNWGYCHFSNSLLGAI